MSEHKPPENDTEKFGDADGTPEWISELYRDAEEDMPPEEVDTQIMRLAAKKAEAPRNALARLHPRSKWVGALASAAVVVLSVGVFLSGEVTQQALEVSPSRSKNAPNLAVEGQAQTPATARLEEVADVSVAAKESILQAEPESVAPMLKVMAPAPQEPQASAEEVELDRDMTDELARNAVGRTKPMLAESKRERRVAAPESSLRLARAGRTPADQAVQTSLVSVAVDCTVTEQGLCTNTEGLFMQHPNCNEGFELPSNAQDVVEAESSVVFRLDSTVVQAQCDAGLWRVSEFEAE